MKWPVVPFQSVANIKQCIPNKRKNVQSLTSWPHYLCYPPHTMCLLLAAHFDLFLFFLKCLPHHTLRSHRGLNNLAAAANTTTKVRLGHKWVNDNKDKERDIAVKESRSETEEKAKRARGTNRYRGHLRPM